MTIFVTCECGKTYQLSDDKAGKRAKCQKCGNPFQVPSAGDVADAPVSSTRDSSGTQGSMNSWDDVRAFILSEYSGRIQEDAGESITLLKYWDDDRSQMIVVRKAMSKTGVLWIDITSPVGIMPDQMLPRVCETLNDWVCGGLTKFGDRYWVRHSMPIGDTSEEELLFPLNIVARGADTLEETFVGGDDQ